MKTQWLVGILALCASHGFCQVVAPASPKKFVTRPIGSSANAGATISPAEPTETKVRYVTHLSLTKVRQWTSIDGKPLMGKLIAFEDMVVETPKGSAEPSAPTPPAHPTVVRNGKIRIMVDSKPFEVALDRLVSEDQKAVEQIRLAYAASPEPEAK